MRVHSISARFGGIFTNVLRWRSTPTKKGTREILAAANNRDQGLKLSTAGVFSRSDPAIAPPMEIGPPSSLEYC